MAQCLAQHGGGFSTDGHRRLGDVRRCREEARGSASTRASRRCHWQPASTCTTTSGSLRIPSKALALSVTLALFFLPSFLPLSLFLSLSARLTASFSTLARLDGHPGLCAVRRQGLATGQQRPRASGLGTSPGSCGPRVPVLLSGTSTQPLHHPLEAAHMLPLLLLLLSDGTRNTH